MGRKLGATPRFGKAAKRRILVVRAGFCVHFGEAPATARKKPGQAKSPGRFARASRIGNPIDQAAGL
jgi:hypothetical protein